MSKERLAQRQPHIEEELSKHHGELHSIRDALHYKAPSVVLYHEALGPRLTPGCVQLQL